MSGETVSSLLDRAYIALRDARGKDPDEYVNELIRRAFDLVDEATTIIDGRDSE